MEEKKPFGKENTEENREEAAARVNSPGEYTPKTKYESVLYRVYCDKGLSRILRVASVLIVAVTALAFLVRVLELVLENPLLLIETLIITGVPFITLSVMRVLINAPRPYEMLEFYEKKPKGKSGRSFPSRHVFSVFVIAAVIMPANVFLGITLALLGTALALFRVLLGIHFIRDVVAGALIGIISGVVGLLALLLI